MTQVPSNPAFYEPPDFEECPECGGEVEEIDGLCSDCGGMAFLIPDPDMERDRIREAQEL